MRFTIFCSSLSLPSVFLRSEREGLEALGIQVGGVLLDANRDKVAHPFRHAWRIARRQGRIAGVSTPLALARKVGWALARSSGRGFSDRAAAPVIEPVVDPIVVPTLNSEAAIRAVRDHGSRVVCLMGTRIIKKEILSALADVTFVNLHSSDPEFVRGGPPFVWEILAGHDRAVLTVHRAVERLDAGEIYAQADVPISFRRSLGATLTATSTRAEPVAAGLFAEVLRGLATGTAEGRDFEPGPLRVTPSIAQMIRADRICRRKA